MRIINRKARYEYETLDKIEGGIVLTGGEIKSLYEGKASIDDAYVKLIGGEIFLINAHIHPYQFSGTADPTRDRKLLLHKKEIVSLQTKIKQKNLTMIPLQLYTKGNKIKLEFALAKGKKAYEKKDSIKERDIQRNAQQELNDNR